MWPIAIVGHLKPGWEDINEIAAHLVHFFESLAKLDPLLTRWVRAGARRHHSVVPALVTIPPDPTELLSWIDEGRVFGSREGRKETVGYSLRALTPEQNPIRADFWLNYESKDWWFARRVGLTIFSGAASPSPFDDANNPQPLVALLQAMLVTMGSTWDCDWAGVKAGNFRLEGGRPKSAPLSKYQGGWMIYLSPSNAAQITQPDDILSERSKDGALLLNAQPKDMFDHRNPAHLAAVLRIQAALEPLNEPKDS